MENKKNILFAFLLNLFFSLFELIGGIFTGSVAILSDAVHDLGDAIGIGASYLCERKSHNKPDERYTYGYIRYSVLGGFITTVILLIGSFGVVYQAVLRLMNPIPIHYNGMVLFAIIGVIVNGVAAYCTREGHSVNQRAVNLHMLEDVLGWIAVLIGALVMRFTHLLMLDSILSIGIALYILVHAFKNLKTVFDIFLEKTPKEIDIEQLKNHICKIPGVESVHHFHIRSLDGFHHDATVHIVTNEPNEGVKHQVREVLEQFHIVHSTIEIHSVDTCCDNEICVIQLSEHHNHHHHHH